LSQHPPPTHTQGPNCSAHPAVRSMAAEAAAAGKEKMRTLVSSDFKKFDVEESVARESLIILNLMADCDDSDIPVFNVNAKILDKVIAYCRKHASAPRADGGDAEPSAASNKASADDLKSFDAEFVDVDLVTLLELIKVRPLHLLSSPDSCLDLILRTVKICLCELL
jgi:hypothetical protein